MMDLQAALGIHQLARIESSWKRRREIWDLYQREFARLPIGLPAEPDPDTRHGYHLYTLFVDSTRARVSRDQFLESMTRQNIGVGVHYQSVPVHPYYQERFGWRPEETPNAFALGSQTVSIPLSPRLSDGDVADVIEAVHNALKAA